MQQVHSGGRRARLGGWMAGGGGGVERRGGTAQMAAAGSRVRISPRQSSNTPHITGTRPYTCPATPCCPQAPPATLLEPCSSEALLILQITSYRWRLSRQMSSSASLSSSARSDSRSECSGLKASAVPQG